LIGLRLCAFVFRRGTRSW